MYANPYSLVSDYTFDLDESTVEPLNIESEEDVIVLTIVTVKEPFKSSTVNLKAPVIFQTNNQKSKTMILNDNTFSMRHPIGRWQKRNKGGRNARIISKKR